MQVSQAATLVGLEAPDAGIDLEIKPYAIGESNSTRSAGPGLANVVTGDIGLDVKYGVTQNLVADLTLNTDFAQVEADEQQVNLTRFSLYFPEKREFFLENQGVFAFGGEAGAGQFAGISNTPILFYSRQIGLHTERGVTREVPIDAGGRLTGRIGRYSLGLLNIRTADAPGAGARPTNFSALRVRRDILRRSNIGAMFTGRSVSRAGPGSNESYGVDGLFSFYQNLNISTYWAETRTPGAALGDDETSYRAQLDYTGDRYGLQLERLAVGENFNPEIGFLRRGDFEQSLGRFRFSPRPRSIESIRQFFWEGQLDYITDRQGVLETRQALGRFAMDFENGDLFDVIYNHNYEFLERPFPIAPGVTIPTAGYRFDDVEVGYSLGQQHRISGRVSAQHGGFYGGTKTSVNFGLGSAFSGTRVEITPQLSIEPNLSLNPGRSARGPVRHDARERADDLRGEPADVRQRPGAVQLRHRQRRNQRAAALGVPPRQRAVRRLQREPRRRPAPEPVPAPREPGVHRQDQPAVPVLSPAAAGSRPGLPVNPPSRR